MSLSAVSESPKSNSENGGANCNRRFHIALTWRFSCGPQNMIVLMIRSRMNSTRGRTVITYLIRAFTLINVVEIWQMCIPNPTRRMNMSLLLSTSLLVSVVRLINRCKNTQSTCDLVSYERPNSDQWNDGSVCIESWQK